MVSVFALRIIECVWHLYLLLGSLIPHVIYNSFIVAFHGKRPVVVRIINLHTRRVQTYTNASTNACTHVRMGTHTRLQLGHHSPNPRARSSLPYQHDTATITHRRHPRSFPAAVPVPTSTFAVIQARPFTTLATTSNTLIIGQVNEKFVACIVNGGADGVAMGSGSGTLVLVDQHAADERIRVEQFLSEICQGFLQHGFSGRVETLELNPAVLILLT